MEKQISVSRMFEAPVEQVWKLWTEPAYIMQWWGPEKFACPSAKIDFKPGGTSVVSMQSPAEFGGKTHYNTWHYTSIVHLESIEFIMNLADENGHNQNPVTVGMPPDFPQNIKTVVVFKVIGKNKTEMTVTQYADFGQMSYFARLGLEQSLTKAVAVFRIL